MLFKDAGEVGVGGGGPAETTEHHKEGVLIYRYLLERGE